MYDLAFFSGYPFLKDHFRHSHYLCEEGECYDIKFTNAFRSYIDYRVHIASSHCQNMKKAMARQVRILDIDIKLTPRYPAGGGRGRRDYGGGGRGRDRGGESI